MNFKYKMDFKNENFRKSARPKRKKRKKLFIIR